MEQFNLWRAEKVLQIEKWLKNFSADEKLFFAHLGKFQSDKKLLEAMQYSLCDGGKRLRAILVYAGGECVGANDAVLNHLSGAVESVHAYSLIHDDLPCMDNDDLRRGRPTCHKVFGEAVALLAGDALHAQAFEMICQIADKHISDSQKLQLISLLTTAIGYNGMVGGQAIDIEFTISPPRDLSPPDIISQLENMHGRKTGALIKVSLLMGILSGNLYTKLSQVPSAIIKYCELLGLLFQVVDDYLDATADSQTLGKTAGKDAKDGKSTYVTVLGLNETQNKINYLLAEIEKGISELDNTFPTNAIARLRNISLWVARRGR